MILGVGVDMVDIARFRSWLSEPEKIYRFFGPEESRYCLEDASSAAASLAARWAAKEALGKALGRGLRGLVLSEVEVTRDGDGQPAFRLGPSVRSVLDDRLARTGHRSHALHLSMTHEGDHAMAFVICEGRD